MKIRIIIRLVLTTLLCLIVTVGCNDKSNTSKRINDGISEEVILNSNIYNDSMLVYDESYIYYINIKDDNKLYKINIKKSKSTKLYDGKISKLMLYKDNLYFIKMDQDSKSLIGNQICSINKDGKNHKVIIEDKDILNYNINGDIIYYNASIDKMNTNELPYEIHNLFSYDMKTKEKSTIDEDVSCQVMSRGIYPINICNNKIYYDTFTNGYVEYNIKTKAKESICENNAMVYNNEIFYINKDTELGELYKYDIDDDRSNIQKIYKSNNKNGIIGRLAVTDEYLFIMYIEDNFAKKLVLNIVRMKHDGSDAKKINSFETIPVGATFYDYMSIVDDKLVVFDYNYENDGEHQIKVMNFDGKPIDFNM